MAPGLAERPPRVLFVCLGNICRSPLAEGALRAAAAQAAVAIEVDSAGTGDWHAGEPPDPRAQAVAAAHGLDLGDLRARQVVPADFHRFDHVVALDLQNLADLRRLAPADASARLSLLLDWVPGRAGEGVSDPWHGEEAGFLVTWRDVSEGTAAMLAALAAGRSPG